jgi:aminoglycoside 6'-N-acetyltransferase I
MTTQIHKITSPEILQKCAPVLMQAYNGEPWNDAWTEQKALETLECFYNSPKFHGFYAEQDGQIIGCCVGNVEPYFMGDYFYLKDMFVSPTDQRKGVGQLLMDELKKELSSIGITTMILFTSDKGSPFDFYTKNDFQLLDGMCMMSFETNK